MILEIDKKLYDAMINALSICEPDCGVCMADVIDERCENCKRLEICRLIVEDGKRAEDKRDE
jgi:hypothetical protein